jgi:hypothetical protein
MGVGWIATASLTGVAVTKVGVAASVGGGSVTVTLASGTAVKVGRAACVCRICALRVAARSGVRVAVSVGVAVAVGVVVWLGVTDGTGVWVRVALGVADGVSVAVGVSVLTSTKGVTVGVVVWLGV